MADEDLKNSRNYMKVICLIVWVLCAQYLANDDAIAYTFKSKYKAKSSGTINKSKTSEFEDVLQNEINRNLFSLRRAHENWQNLGISDVPRTLTITIELDTENGGPKVLNVVLHDRPIPSRIKNDLTQLIKKWEFSKLFNGENDPKDWPIKLSGAISWQTGSRIQPQITDRRPKPVPRGKDRIGGFLHTPPLKRYIPMTDTERGEEPFRAEALTTEPLTGKKPSSKTEHPQASATQKTREYGSSDTDQAQSSGSDIPTQSPNKEDVAHTPSTQKYKNTKRGMNLSQVKSVYNAMLEKYRKGGILFTLLPIFLCIGVLLGIIKLISRRPDKKKNPDIASPQEKKNIVAKSVSPRVFDPKSQVKEYKRICNQCGKIWHSLTSREEAIEKDARCNDNAALFDTCWGDNTDVATRLDVAKHEGRARASWNAVGSLRRCPNCGSVDYSEKILVYEKR